MYIILKIQMMIMKTIQYEFGVAFRITQSKIVEIKILQTY